MPTSLVIAIYNNEYLFVETGKYWREDKKAPLQLQTKIGELTREEAERRRLFAEREEAERRRLAAEREETERRFVAELEQAERRRLAAERQAANVRQNVSCY
jgi:hypothetical protein